MTGDMSEIVGFLQAGEVKALAVLTEERVPGFEDIFLGSTADWVVRHAKCAVHVIR